MHGEGSRCPARHSAGFTLIELLVVVVIIGLLAAIAIPSYLGHRRRSWESAVVTDLRNASSAVEAWASTNVAGGVGTYTGLTTTKLTATGATDVGFVPSKALAPAGPFTLTLVPNPVVAPGTTYCVQLWDARLGSATAANTFRYRRGSDPAPVKGIC